MARIAIGLVLCFLCQCRDETPPAAVRDAAIHVTVQPREAEPAQPAPLRVVVFSKTQGFRHDTIEPGQRALADIAKRHGAEITFTEDAAQLIEGLSHSDVVLFLMTTGDVLSDEQQPQLERYVRDGGGFVGVHSAADTEYDWPFYGELVGARFDSHPAVQSARVLREASDPPAVAFLPAVWQRADEWYNFRANPRGAVDVLLTLDEASYEGGTMGADHPIAWSHTVGRGRALYTALGHTQESWQEPLFVQHLEHSLLWAAGR
jgi:type 1 glutamine amidotransferase